MPARIDIKNQKFNRLLALKYAYSENKRTYWWFKCDCGKTVARLLNTVKKGGTASCGCLREEWMKKTFITHELTGTRFYFKFNNIRMRCNNPLTLNYHRYGGRGIKCKWKTIVEFKRDMYESYLIHVKKFGEKQTTIDRIDNNGHYCKENCRWATRKEQARNKSNSRSLTLNGTKKTITDWSKITGVSYKTIVSRLRYGWSIKKTLTQK